MTNILTNAELAAYAPDLDTSAYNPTTLSGIINAATRRVAGFCNVDGFDFTAVTDEKARAKITAHGELMINVRRKPIVSVESAGLTSGGQDSTISLDDGAGNPTYDMVSSRATIFIPSARISTGDSPLVGNLLSMRGSRMFATVSYHGGYQVIPEDLKEACGLFIRDKVQTKGQAGLRAITQGGYREEYDTRSSTSGKSDYVVTAESILNGGGFVNPDIF